MTMATTGPIQTKTLSDDPGWEMRTGGAMLFTAAILFLVTIGCELIVGWPPSGGAPTAADISAFMLQHWPTLRWIWAAQMLSGYLIGLSALLLLRSRHLHGLWRPGGFIWSTVAIAGIVLTVSYGLALGSYPPALRAAGENPEILTTVRGGVRFLGASAGAVVVAGCIILFIREGVAKDGVVPRSWILATALAVLLAIVTSAIGILPSTAGVAILLVPALLGLALWRAGRQLVSRANTPMTPGGA
jgi:hypothetical protein